MKTESASETVAQLRSVRKSYDNGTLALDGIDLDILDGEFLCLLGPSGCGKSTILRLLAGLSNPSSGILHRSTPTVADLGYVFQDPTLMPWATVTDNVALPLQLWRKPKAEIATEVARVLDMVGLANFANAYPRELSGGMKMRVSIARALVTRPKLLLMDEPFAALDEITRGRLDDDLLAIRQKSGCTIVFVTHSTAESVYLATRIAVMRSRPGQIVGYIDVSAERRDAYYRVSQEFAKTAADVTEMLGRGEAA